MKRRCWSLRPKIGYLAISFCVLAFVTGTALASATNTAANTVGVSPVNNNQTVGSTFTVTVYSNTSVPLSGAAAGLNFDRTRLQLTSLGQNQTIASDGGQYIGWPADTAGMATFVTQANDTGEIPVISWAYINGSSTKYGSGAPAGTNTIFSATFKVTACGSTRLDPATALGGLIDGTGNGQVNSPPQPYGNPVSIDAVASAYVIDPCASGCSSSSPTPSATANPTPTGSSSASQGTASPTPASSLDPCFNPCATSSLATPTPSPTPSPSGIATTPPFPCPSGNTAPSGSAAPSAGSPTPRPTASTPDWLEVPPAPSGVGIGTIFTISIVAHHSIPLSGLQATLLFDNTKLQVQSVTLGSAWASAAFKNGLSQSDVDSANQSGDLYDVAATFIALPPSFPSVAGPASETFLTVTMKAVACGHSDLGLPVANDPRSAHHRPSDDGQPGDDGNMVNGTPQLPDYGAQVKDVSAIGSGVEIACSAGPSFLATPTPSPSPTHTPAPTPTPRPYSNYGGGSGNQTVVTVPVSSSSVEAATSEPAVSTDPGTDTNPAPAASPASGTSTKKDGDDSSVFAVLSLAAGGAWAAALWALERFGTAIFKL